MVSTKLIGFQALAHEIAVDKDFAIKKADFPPSSFEGTFKSILHKAFWDLMEEKLQEDPPDYESAISVFEDIKKLLDAILLPQVCREIASLHTHITKAKINVGRL